MKDYLLMMDRSGVVIDNTNWLDLVKKAGWCLVVESVWFEGTASAAASVALSIPSSKTYTRIAHPFRTDFVVNCDMDSDLKGYGELCKNTAERLALDNMWDRNKNYIMAGLVQALDHSFRMPDFDTA